MYKSTLGPSGSSNDSVVQGWPAIWLVHDTLLCKLLRKAEKGKSPQRGKERGTKAMWGKYKVDCEDRIKDRWGQGRWVTKKGVSAFLLVYMDTVYVQVDKQKNESAHWNSFYCASQALNRQHQRWRGRPTVEKHILGSEWLALLSFSEYLNIMFSLCTEQSLNSRA